MLRIANRNLAQSQGLNRRELLRVGALGLSGLTLADLLAASGSVRLLRRGPRHPPDNGRSR